MEINKRHTSSSKSITPVGPKSKKLSIALCSLAMSDGYIGYGYIGVPGMLGERGVWRIYKSCGVVRLLWSDLSLCREVVLVWSATIDVLLIHQDGSGPDFLGKHG